MRGRGEGGLTLHMCMCTPPLFNVNLHRPRHGGKLHQTGFSALVHWTRPGNFLLLAILRRGGAVTING
jgi:hypothetical protein